MDSKTHAISLDFVERVGHELFCCIVGVLFSCDSNSFSLLLSSFAILCILCDILIGHDRSGCMSSGCRRPGSRLTFPDIGGFPVPRKFSQVC